MDFKIESAKKKTMPMGLHTIQAHALVVRHSLGRNGMCVCTQANEDIELLFF